MANNYECAPTRVEVPSPGSTTTNTDTAVPSGLTPTSAHPMASYSPMGANDNIPEIHAFHMSSITADGVHDYSHCSAFTAGSEHDPPLLHLDTRGLEHYGHVHDVPRDNPDLVMGWCGIAPPVAAPSLWELSHHAYAPCAALSYDSPPCVASAVVVNSSCNSHACNTYHPAERKNHKFMQVSLISIDLARHAC
jgi:hypothetical protein